MKKFGIDISKWQGDFNITHAKNIGVDFVIIKIGGGDVGNYKDPKFETNYNKCINNDLPKGCYFFGNAITVTKAKKEAEYWVKLMKEKKFEYPVFYDVEANMLNTSKRALTDIILSVGNILEENGYWFGVYASENTFNTKVYDNELSKYTHWVAKWSTSKPKLKHSETQMWQFGGETNYIRTNKMNGQVVDQNYSYIDFPTLIQKKKLNGFNVISEIRKTNTEIAYEVINGKWGNGNARKQALTESGYNYLEIQKIVNHLVNI